MSALLYTLTYCDKPKESTNVAAHPPKGLLTPPLNRLTSSCNQAYFLYNIQYSSRAALSFPYLYPSHACTNSALTACSLSCLIRAGSPVCFDGVCWILGSARAGGEGSGMNDVTGYRGFTRAQLNAVELLCSSCVVAGTTVRPLPPPKIAAR